MVAEAEGEIPVRYTVCASLVLLLSGGSILLAQEGTPAFMGSTCTLIDQPNVHVPQCTLVGIVDGGGPPHPSTYEINYFNPGIYHKDLMAYSDQHWVTGYVAKDCVKEGTIKDYSKSECFAKQKKQEDDWQARLAEQNRVATEQQAQAEIEQEEFQRREQARLQEEAKKGPAPGTTLYRGMYIGEPLLAVKPGTCFKDFEAADTALASGLVRQACFLITQEHEISMIVDFVLGPAPVVYDTLTKQYGAPRPGYYRMLGNEGEPEWKFWLRHDGISISAKTNLSMNGRNTYAEIVVFKYK